VILTVDVLDWNSASGASERALIGTLIRYPDRLIEAMETLKPSDFNDVHCGAFYGLMCSRAGEGKLPDEIDLPVAATRQIPRLDPQWVYEAIEDATTDHTDSLVARVARESKIRSATMASLQMCRDLQAADAPVESITAKHAEGLLNVTEGDSDTSMDDAVSDSIYHFEQARQGHTVAYSTGSDSLDRWLQLVPGRLYILAARPGMGKTALALHIAQAKTDGERYTWGVVSLEMSAAELAGRLVCRAADVDIRGYETGRLHPASIQAVATHAQDVAQYPIRIDDRSGLTWGDIAAKARKWSLLHGLNGLIIDYAQLIRKVDPRITNNDHVAEISKGCKALARDLDVPVVLLSQLNRQCEQRQDKRPMCSDLRDSGSLEQDADAVLMLYRHDVYEDNVTNYSHEAEVLIRKNRAGPLGTVRMMWTGRCARFDEVR